MSFSDLGLSAELLRALDTLGYTQATPIQQQAIPPLLAGRDILAGAQTGTGKTAGFALPLLQKLQAESAQDGPRAIRVLILVPTRELAAQVADSLREYGRNLPFRTQVVFGGVSINTQMMKLRKSPDILVATPGRLLDLINRGCVKLDQLHTLVLDEADRMLDMGFIHDIRKVIRLLPVNRQTLMFSATFSDEIRTLAGSYLNDPVEVSVARKNTAAESVSQIVYKVDKQRKRELLSWLIGSQNWQQVLVFTRTKHGANRLSKQLDQDGLKSEAIHGNKSQGARTRALADFKSGKVRVLVATDIAARGLDIQLLPHVVNYELPNVPEDYVHRIGRTGRAGQEGCAVSLVCVDERKLLADIERVINRQINECTQPGFEPDPSIRAEPIFKKGGGSGRSGRPGQHRSQQARGSNGNGGRHRSGPRSGGSGKPASAGKRNGGGGKRRGGQRSRQSA